MLPSSRGEAEQGTVIHRLEGEMLAVGLQQRLDLRERRAGARRDHQLFRLVKRYAFERGEREFLAGRGAA